MKSQDMMFLAAMFLVSAALLAIALVRIMRRGGHWRSGDPAGRKLARDVNELTKRLEQTAQRISARVETQLSQLRQLQQQLEERAAQLATMLDRTGTAGDNYPPLPLESQQQEIVRLSRQGIDPVGIARRLELSVGEVELSLNLQRSLADGKQPTRS